jgi:hypothetical protein
VRSDAKASTAGSTMRQAKGLGRIFRGADATRGISPRANGSGAPKAGRLVIPVGVFVAIVATMALVVSPASATKTHLFEETFGSAAQPSFTSARGIAIDQSSGDVLVMDAGSPPSIKRYNADGSADSFPATGTNAIDGTGAGDATPQNGLGFASASESQIAVDNSGAATDGNIYVTQGSPNAINVFSEEGAYLGQLTAAGATPFSEACGVAVDSAGAVYVGDYTGGVHRFAPAANPPVNADHTATFTSVTQPCTLAAGIGPTAGFLFAATYSGTTKKIDSGTGELKYTVSADTTTTISVDPGTGRLYNASGSTFKELDASGAASATAISSVSLASQAQGLAIRGSTGDVYVSRSGNAKVEVFGPTVALPNVTTGSATAIEETTATLNGTVNPDGVELSECKFEYGKTTSYGSSIPCAQSPAAIGSGTSDVAVSANLSGLDLGAEYHFRLVATNPNGTVNGADKAFKLKSPPVLKGEWATGVIFTEATLRAKINPEGFATTYEFEWGTDASYGNTTPVSAVGSDKADHTVGALLEGLNPGTTYHYRVIASNSIGTSEGPDRTFTTYEPVALNSECPNQSFRAGPSASLPDCRAYEMVSPVDKNGGDAWMSFGINQSTPEGDGLGFSAPTSFADAAGSPEGSGYIATREAGGWSTRNVTPPIEADGDTISNIVDPFFSFSPDLSSVWVRNDNVVPLTPDAAPGGYNHLYRRDNLAGSFEALINTPPLPPSDTPGNLAARIVGFTEDFEHQVFETSARLTADTPLVTLPNRTNIYDLHEGELHLVNVLPDGTGAGTNSKPFSGTGAYFTDLNDAVYYRPLSNVISEDGSRIFWSHYLDASQNIGPVYVRENPEQEQSALSGGACTEPAKACTVKLSPDDKSRFVAATPDGSKVLLTSETNALSVVDVDTLDVRPIADEVYSPDILISNGVLGTSEDLSHVYFVSEEALAPGASAGQFNLYVDHEGAKTFIAALSATDVGATPVNVTPGPIATFPGYHSSRVSPDGSHIAFTSNRALTGYDTTDPLSGKPVLEVYTYELGGELLCASCNPSGAAPEPDFLRDPFHRFERLAINVPPIPTAASLPTSENGLNPSRPLSEDGSRVFFDSFEALVPQDTNGIVDIYQWEVLGSGDCTEGSSAYSELNGGCISLISTGKSNRRSRFVDASENGDSVFFRTISSISPQDPGAEDIYVARAGGGFPIPVEPPPCEGDACQSIPPAPDDPTPASAGFRGAGDPVPLRDCSVQARQAAKLTRRARRLRRAAEGSDSAKQAKALRKRAASSAKRAKALGKSASRCRRANRGAGR